MLSAQTLGQARLNAFALKQYEVLNPALRETIEGSVELLTLLVAEVERLQRRLGNIETSLASLSHELDTLYQRVAKDNK